MRHETKARKIARKVSGICIAVFFILMLGTAGRSDMGADLSEVFPAGVFYTAGMIVSQMIWEKCGGNGPENWSK